MPSICPTCSMQNNDGAMFCRHCGMPITPPQPQGNSWPPAPPPPPASYGPRPAPAPPPHISGPIQPPPSYYPSVYQQPPQQPAQPPSQSYPPPGPQPYQSYPPSNHHPQYAQPPAPYQQQYQHGAPPQQFGYQQPGGWIVKANPILRWLALVIDSIIILPFFLLALIPLIGGLLAALIGVAYWLLRDSLGASIGKQVVGLRIVMEDGRPPDRSALILRNVTLALPSIFLIIPYLGIVLCLFVAIPILLIEDLSALFAGRRVGETFAKTYVVPR